MTKKELRTAIDGQLVQATVAEAEGWEVGFYIDHRWVYLTGEDGERKTFKDVRLAIDAARHLGSLSITVDFLPSAWRS